MNNLTKFMNESRTRTNGLTAHKDDPETEHKGGFYPTYRILMSRHGDYFFIKKRFMVFFWSTITIYDGFSSERRRFGSITEAETWITGHIKYLERDKKYDQIVKEL